MAINENCNSKFTFKNVGINDISEHGEINTAEFDISVFMENLKEYNDPTVHNADASKHKFVADAIFHQIHKNSSNQHSDFNASQNQVLLNDDTTQLIIENFDDEQVGLENEAIAFSKVIKDVSTFGDMCLQIKENSLLQFLRNYSRKTLNIILKCLESRRSKYEMLRKIKIWNELFDIEKNYQTMISALSNIHDKQPEKGLEKLKKHMQRHKQRSSKQVIRRPRRIIVRLSETKGIGMIEVDHKHASPINLRERKILQSLMTQPIPTFIPVEEHYPLDNLFNNPSQRLYTFSEWPLRTNFWPQQLANAGFYYTREGTVVRCATCGISTSVENWSRQDRPETIHFNLNKECEFIKGNFPHLVNQTENSFPFDPTLTKSASGSLQDDTLLVASHKSSTQDHLNCNGLNEYQAQFDTHRDAHISSNHTGDGIPYPVTPVHGESTCTPQIKKQNIESMGDCGDAEVPLPQELTQNGSSVNHFLFQKGFNGQNETHVMSSNMPLLTPTKRQSETNETRNKNILCTEPSIPIPLEGDRNKVKLNVPITENSVSGHMEQNIQPGILPSFGSVPSLDRSAHLQNGYKQSVDVDQPPSTTHRQLVEHRAVIEPDFPFPQFRTFDERVNTFNNWPTSSVQSPRLLAETGCFYTGEDDIVRCFCCNLGLAEWAATDDPWIEHARHNPKCWFLREQKGQSFIDKVQDEWKKRYKPKNPAFDDLVSRLATFDGWRDDIEQTPELLADAGFFFTGEDDIVRCHYCDGGLRNWEQGDEPWEEHARWFPNCKFLIKMKGCQYINSIKEKYQNANSSGQEEQETSGFLSTEAARTLLNMQIPVNDVKLAINNFIKRKGHTNFKVDDLFDLLFETKSGTSNNPSASGALAAQNRPLPAERDPAHLKVVNAELKKNLLCVICNKNERCMLFVNCGHRLTCEQCCRSIDFCPYCDKRIKKVLKTFLS